MSDFGAMMEAARVAGLPISAPAVVDVPVISGGGAVGDTLTVTMGNWTNVPTDYIGEWMRGGSGKVGEGPEYVVQEMDVDHAITCVVTAINGWGRATAPPSNEIVATAAAAQAATASAERGSSRRHTSQ